jgi:hypothetical protein
MRDKSKKIAEFGDIQHAVLISVGHLEFSLDEAQQLVLTHGAFVVLTVAMAGAFVHVGPPTMIVLAGISKSCQKQPVRREAGDIAPKDADTLVNLSAYLRPGA